MVEPADSGSRRTTELVYRPAQVALMLGCSEWWIKEQARKRRIPFSWIGGSYRFTDEHVADIVRRFEVRPTEGGSPLQTPVPRVRVERTEQPAARLTARTPRRAAQHTNAA